jgi:hypothetical protein
VATLNLDIDDEHLPAIDDVVSHIRSTGATVQDVLRSIGVITFEADPDVVSALADIPGVSAVVPDGEITVAPPTSEIQ